MANLITILRVVLLFAAVWLIFSGSSAALLTALAIVAVVILLDWADGAVARLTGRATTAGAVLDILADRVIENTLWIVFAQLALVPVWMPLVVLVRGLTTDAVRAVALARGLTPFGTRSGAPSMMRSRIGRALVSSRSSRALYAVAKFVTFCYLIFFLAVAAGPPAHWPVSALVAQLPRMQQLGLGLAYFTVGFCLVRGIPVLVDGWTLLRKE